MSPSGQQEPDPAPQDTNEELEGGTMTVDAATQLLQQVVDAGGVPGQDGPIRVFVPRHGLVSFTINARGRVIAHPSPGHPSQTPESVRTPFSRAAKPMLRSQP